MRVEMGILRILFDCTVMPFFRLPRFFLSTNFKLFSWKVWQNLIPAGIIIGFIFTSGHPKIGWGFIGYLSLFLAIGIIGRIYYHKQPETMSVPPITVKEPTKRPTQRKAPASTNDIPDFDESDLDSWGKWINQNPDKVGTPQ